MSRPFRKFKAGLFKLEGRLLLAVAPAPVPDGENVQFEGTSSPGATPPTEVVGQQDGEAIVGLSRLDNSGRLQVQVTTDPSSPAVGVNVAPVDQTVTFANLQSEAVVRIPLLAGAPNPGEVDVNLDVTSLTPRVTTSGPLELRILASDATIPPAIVAVEGKSQGIVLTFNKPMNPAGAANLNNYAVSWQTSHSKYDDLGVFALLMPWNNASTTSRGQVQLRAARYDPSTNSVTLISKRELKYPSTLVTVTQGHPAKTSSEGEDPSNPGPALTDLDGNPINAGTAEPGQFSVVAVSGSQPTF